MKTGEKPPDHDLIGRVAAPNVDRIATFLGYVRSLVEVITGRLYAKKSQSHPTRKKISGST
jgi:hypothetical protein